MIASLRQVGVIAAHYLRRTALDAALVWLVAMPLAIIYILGITMHGLFSAEFTPAKPYRIVLALVDETQRIADSFSQAPDYFAVDQVATEQDARRAVLEREADAAIIGTGGDPAFKVIAPPGSVVIEILAAALRKIDQEQGYQSPPPEQAQANGESGRAATALDPPWVGVGSFEYFSVAITVMFMTFACHSAMTYTAEDRTTGTYWRIRAMGISRSTYLAAGFASAALIGAVFALMMAVMTRVLFRVVWGDSVAWTLMTIGGAVSIAALSFLIMALLPDNPRSVENAGGAVYTILSFLGGSTVPLTLMPGWFLRIFSWLPNRRMLDGYLAIAQGAGVTSLGRELLGLAAATLAMLAMAGLIMRTMKREGA